MRVRAAQAQERSFRTRATRTYRHSGQELRQPSRQSARRTCNPYIPCRRGVRVRTTHLIERSATVCVRNDDTTHRT
eukprot:scaffold137203_cov537-Phaeocystis_antarctica.AAC.3